MKLSPKARRFLDLAVDAYIAETQAKLGTDAKAQRQQLRTLRYWRRDEITPIQAEVELGYYQTLNVLNVMRHYRDHLKAQHDAVIDQAADCANDLGFVDAVIADLTAPRPDRYIGILLTDKQRKGGVYRVTSVTGTTDEGYPSTTSAEELVAHHDVGQLAGMMLSTMPGYEDMNMFSAFMGQLKSGYVDEVLFNEFQAIGMTDDFRHRLDAAIDAAPVLATSPSGYECDGYS